LKTSQALYPWMDCKTQRARDGGVSIAMRGITQRARKDGELIINF